MDEEPVKPCIQDRVRDVVRAQGTKFILWVFAIITIYAALVFGTVSMFEKDAIRLLVEVETTILGFYGLIYVSLLNSINVTIERQFTLREMTEEPPETRYPHQILNYANDYRERVMTGFTVIFYKILISMIFGIASIAMYDFAPLGDVLLYLNVIGAFLFFSSISQFVNLMTERQ